MNEQHLARLAETLSQAEKLTSQVRQTFMAEVLKIPPKSPASQQDNLSDIFGEDE